MIGIPEDPDTDCLILQCWIIKKKWWWNFGTAYELWKPAIEQPRDKKTLTNQKW